MSSLLGFTTEITAFTVLGREVKGKEKLNEESNKEGEEEGGGRGTFKIIYRRIKNVYIHLYSDPLMDSERLDLKSALSRTISCMFEDFEKEKIFV